MINKLLTLIDERSNQLISDKHLFIVRTGIVESVNDDIVNVVMEDSQETYALPNKTGGRLDIGNRVFVIGRDGLSLSQYGFIAFNEAILESASISATINEVLIEGDLDSVADLKIAGKIVNESGGEVFNDYGNNIASGAYSNTSGHKCESSGDYSSTSGESSTASGAYGNARGGSCHAGGYAGNAMGYGCIANGNYSVAMGNGCGAYGNCSVAMGSTTITYGKYSIAVGGGSRINGKYSGAFGQNLITSSDWQIVTGKNNIEDADNKYAFIIGNGSLTNRSNAFAIDWSGNIYTNGSTTGVNINTFEDRITTLESNISFATEDEIASLFA